MCRPITIQCIVLPASNCAIAKAVNCKLLPAERRESGEKRRREKLVKEEPGVGVVTLLEDRTVVVGTVGTTIHFLEILQYAKFKSWFFGKAWKGKAAD